MYRHFRLFVFACVCIAVLSACSRPAQVFQQHILALGTLVDISIYGADAGKAEAAATAITGEMQEVTRHWHAWKPGRLMQINQQLQAGNAVTLSDTESRIFQEAMTLASKSDYSFDPAIGKMVALWGFHQDVRPDNLPPPSQTAIRALLQQHPSMADLTLKDNVLRSRNPAVQLDFGGFAKGVAIDRGIAALKKLGINNAIVNAGGDMRVIGSKGGKPWQIGIRHPRAGGVIASIAMRGDESIYTSGDYERFFIYQGHRYHHIIDPRTGMPAPGVSSVTVVQTNAALAEAADKALFIAGPKGFAKMAAQLGITQAMLVDTQGTVYMTPAMAKRIHFEVTPAPKAVVVQ